MPKILDRLPIPTNDDVAFVRGETVRVKAYQIVVWVSLSAKPAVEWNPAMSRFPAILDTGHTHNFSIREEHLIRWAGLRPEMLRLLGTVRQAGQHIPLHAANLWVHRNQPGWRDQFRNVPPHCLELPRGIAVYASEGGFPRLPLVGMRALISNRLHLAIDGSRSKAWLRTPNWLHRVLQALRVPPY